MLTDVARYDKGLVKSETEITDEGYIKATAIVTRCGVFLYKNLDGTIRSELRHPDDVLVPKSLESIKMIPVVNGHPPERLVTVENAKKLAVGYTGEKVEQEYPYIIANLMITDKDTIEQVKAKKNSELSLGYTVDLIPEKGTFYGEPYEFRQTNIKYNHLALVDNARAGSEARITLDADDAVEVEKKPQKDGDKTMTAKKSRKVKIDEQEYMLEEDAANQVESMIAQKNKLLAEKDSLEKKIEQLENQLDTAHAERDSMRDKDYHDPESVHHPLEADEIGSEGKEKPDPVDSYGMQSHVKDFQKPSHMENHVVKEPGNKHYPQDLPHISKVDAAEVQKQVKERVKLERLSEKYLDKKTLARLDSMTDIELKKQIILNFQPNAKLDGKSEVYVNARFDAALENVPTPKVVAMPSLIKGDEDSDKENANASEARKAMIKKMKNAYRGGK